MPSVRKRRQGCPGAQWSWRGRQPKGRRGGRGWSDRCFAFFLSFREASGPPRVKDAIARRRPRLDSAAAPRAFDRGHRTGKAFPQYTAGGLMNVTGGRVAPGHNVGVAGVSLGEKSLFYRGVLLCGQSSARGHCPSHSFPTMTARSEDTGSKPNAKAQRQNHVTVQARTTPTPKPIAK